MMRAHPMHVLPVLVCVFALMPVAASAASVTLDPAFSSDGVATFSAAALGLDAAAEVSSVFRLSSGKTALSGYETGGAPALSFLMQVNGNGLIDSAFGVSGRVNLDLGSTTEAHGQVRFGNNAFLSGFYDDGAGEEGGFVGYFAEDGDLIAGFNGGVLQRAETGLSYPVVLVDDGGGTLSFGYNSIVATSSIARYSGSGIDTSWATSGFFNLGEGRVRAALLDDDSGGKIVVVTEAPSDDLVSVHQVTQMGVYDTAFGTSGEVTFGFAADAAPQAKAVAMSPGGKIAVAGSYAVSGFPDRYGFIYVINANGTLDPGFNDDGFLTVATGVSDDEVTALAYDEEGVLFAGGTLDGVAGAVRAYDAEGSLEDSYSGGEFTLDEEAGGDVRLHYDDGVLTEAFANSDRSAVVVARYLVDRDADDDGVADEEDNCVNESNPGQEDGDSNDIGDACEARSGGDSSGGGTSLKNRTLRILREYIRENDLAGLAEYVREHMRRLIRYRDGGTELPYEVLALLASPAEEAAPEERPAALPEVRDLEAGMEGTDVRMLQELLIAHNAGPSAAELGRVGATGYFGTYTRNALSEYQRMRGITPSAGYFGPITREQMKLDGMPGAWW